jgi:aerobic-type carbon monoxide dehydrogenase small subunit (CoxS/CutS family)
MDHEPDVPKFDDAETGRATRRQMLFGGALAAGVAATAGAARDAQAASLPAKKKKPTNKKAQPPSRRSPRTTTLHLNGKEVKVTSPGSTMLLYVLRDELELRGPRFGCGLAECGACSVLLNGQETRSCVTPLSTVGAQKVTTLEGLGPTYHGPGKPAGSTLHPLQQAWIDEQVPQCGYCQSGMMIQAADLLSKTPRPSEAQIKQAMNGHLCRCGTHFRILTAIKRASVAMDGA